MRVFRGFSRPVPAPTALAIGNFDGAAPRPSAPCSAVWSRSRAMPRCRRRCSPSNRIRASSSLLIRRRPACRRCARRSNCSPRPASPRPWSAASTPPSPRSPPMPSSTGCWCGGAARPAPDRRRRLPLRRGAGRRFRAAAGRPARATASRSRRWTASRSTASGCRVPACAGALAAGDMEHAARLLGRPYIIDGRVVHGDKLGRAARLSHRQHPHQAQSAADDRRLRGRGQRPRRAAAARAWPTSACRPTVGGTRPLLEVHLFDFDRDIYGAHISVRFRTSCATSNASPISTPSRRRSRPMPRRRGLSSSCEHAKWLTTKTR